MAKKKWSWALLILPILAIVDAVVVGLYGAGTLDVTELGDSVRIFHVVLVGIAVFLLLLILEVIILARSFGDEGAPRPVDEELEEAPEEAPARAPATAWQGTEGPEIEYLQTADELEGKRVIEVARPPKTAVDGGIYATTYLPINEKFVLRLEELVAFQGVA